MSYSKEDLLKELYTIDTEIENLKLLELDDEQQIKELEELKKMIEQKLKTLN